MFKHSRMCTTFSQITVTVSCAKTKGKKKTKNFHHIASPFKAKDWDVAIKAGRRGKNLSTSDLFHLILFPFAALGMGEQAGSQTIVR